MDGLGLVLIKDTKSKMIDIRVVGIRIGKNSSLTSTKNKVINVFSCNLGFNYISIYMYENTFLEKISTFKHDSTRDIISYKIE